MLPSLSPDQRKELVRHYLETTWNHQETDDNNNYDSQHGQDDSQQNIYASCADTISIYLGDERLHAPLTQLRTTVRKTFPDIYLTIIDLLVEGEKVVVRWMMRGTDLGGYDNHLPTGKAVCITGISILRLEYNTIMEEWIEVDTARMLRQLGFVYVPQPPKITMRRPGPPFNT